MVLVPGEDDEDNNFIEDPFLGFISGYVLNDLDVPMPGITISLYADSDLDGNEDGAVLSTEVADGTGYYVFQWYRAWILCLGLKTQVMPYSSISDRDTSINVLDLDGDDTADGPDNDIPVTLMPGEGDLDNIFVNGRPGTICGSVKDDTGLPISNVVLNLYADDNGDGIADGGILATTMSDGDSGNYCFSDIEPERLCGS